MAWYNLVCEKCEEKYTVPTHLWPTRDPLHNRCYRCGGRLVQVIEGEYAQAKPLQLPTTT